MRITGNTAVFMERFVENSKHIEIQSLADRHGNVLTFGARDCSAQRRKQKIIEETPPPNINPQIISKMEKQAVKLLKFVNYEGAATVEFIFDVDSNKFYFMEVNTRLQVEHPITEQLYSCDLVKSQIQIARGESIGRQKFASRGNVIEVRLNAEDPEQDFMPMPGKVSRFELPAGPGIRVDSGVEANSIIPSEFDSMIAKIIVSGNNRPEAIARLKRALKELKICVEEGTTNRAFLLELLNTDEMRQGNIDTNFVKKWLKNRPEVITRTKWDIVLVSCAIEQYISNYQEEPWQL